MKPWSFKVFVTTGGRDSFQEWITPQGADAEQKIRATIKLLSISDIRAWGRPHFSKLRGCDNIHEIIVKGKPVFDSHRLTKNGIPIHIN